MPNNIEEKGAKKALKTNGGQAEPVILTTRV
jgi:hypothetical protein